MCLNNMRYFSCLVIAAMIFGASLTSCGKQDPQYWLPKSIIVSQHNASTDNIHQIMYEFEYDGRNRLTTGRAQNHYSFVYNDDGDIVEYASCYIPSRCYRTTFSLNGNKISFITNYHPSVTLSGTVTGELELDAHGLPVKLIYEDVSEYLSTGSNYWTNTTVTLTWQNGNIVKAEREGYWKSEIVRLNWETQEIDRVEREEGSRAGTVTYTYDNMKTPFHFCNTPKWFLWWVSYYRYLGIYGHNRNNIITETTEDGSTTTYNHTYKQSGFPVTRRWGTAEIWTNGSTTEMYTYN